MQSVAGFVDAEIPLISYNLCVLLCYCYFMDYRYFNIATSVQFDPRYQFSPGESGTMSGISCTSQIAILRSYPVCTAFRLRMRNAITHVTRKLDIDRPIKLISSLSHARFVRKVSYRDRDPWLHFYHSLRYYCITGLEMQNLQENSSGRRARWKLHITKCCN